MEVLTREQAIANHKAMWNKIAELLDETNKTGEGRLPNIVEYKRKALEQLGYKDSEMPTGGCWCCEWAKVPDRLSSATIKCGKCPLDWGGACYCYQVGSPYRQLQDIVKLGFYREAVELAKQVANLPERTDV